jgi:hypothetical protein
MTKLIVTSCNFANAPTKKVETSETVRKYVYVSATGRSLVQRSLTDCGCVTVCNHMKTTLYT